MTSSQPITTPNALNFTPDNKHCYAYSGLAQTAGDNSPETRLEFDTNSEYIKADILVFLASGNNDDLYYQIYFNDVQVAQSYEQTPPNLGTPNTARCIIPPFTNVKIKVANAQSSTARDLYIMVSGEAVGMVVTGYQ